MEELYKEFSSWLTPERLRIWWRVAIVLVVGVIVARVAGMGLGRVVTRRFGPSQGILARRVVWYGLLFVVLATCLRQLGFDLGVLLGAAGILTVAIGFASQTSASNLISGLFLLAERPFTVGDVVMIGQTLGEVIAIDLLSVKLRTFDNLLVRIPNETLLKSEIRNWSGFPLRRVDIPVGVSYDSDLEAVRDVLFEVADNHPLCLDEPRPLFQVLGFADSSINLQFSVWAVREEFLTVKTAMYFQIHQAFAEKGITIPFPQRVIHQAGEGKAPKSSSTSMGSVPSVPSVPSVADKPGERR